MDKKVAIVQSNYIPWKGYFDLINQADEFILYDDVQYTRRDWRNRNKIKTHNGPQWLTIPVLNKGNYFEPIKSIQVSNRTWADDHWKTIRFNYAKAPYFADYAPILEQLYKEAADQTLLSQINYLFMSRICELLTIKTRITWSMDYRLDEGKTERLISLCQQAGATEYLCGPASKNYIDESLFASANIRLTYMDYEGYPEYPQLFPPFEHSVSVLDLILNTGSQACFYMKSFRGSV